MKFNWDHSRVLHRCSQHYIIVSRFCPWKSLWQWERQAEPRFQGQRRGYRALITHIQLTGELAVTSWWPSPTGRWLGSTPGNLPTARKCRYWRGIWAACHSIRYTPYMKDEDIFACMCSPISGLPFQGHTAEFLFLSFREKLLFLSCSFYFKNSSFYVLFCNHILYFFSINSMFQWIPHS